jgi:hypothetical protein
VLAFVLRVVESAGAALEKWTKPVTVVAGVISLVWSILLLPFQRPTEYLVVWIRDDKIVYPSEVTSDKSLPLTYRGTPVQSARILTVRIQNRGSAPIGKSESLWEVALTAHKASNLALLERPQTSPIQFFVEDRPSDDPRTVVIKFGLLDARSTVDLQMLLVNQKANGLPLTASPTLAGLPRHIGINSPSGQLIDRYYWTWAAPIILLAGVFFLPPLAREWYGRVTWKRVLLAPVYVFFGFVAVVGPASLWVLLLAHAVSWVYY